jgi:hypothetical protein
MFIAQFLIGILFAAFGALIIRYTPWIVQNVAPIGWAERHLAAGGSYFVYRVLGLVIFLGGLLYAIGLLDAAVRLVLGPILGLLGY